MPAPQDQERCTLCKNDNNEEMVSCDICKSWAHYECAGVSAEILEFAWHCAQCDLQGVTRKIYDRFMKEREARIEANKSLKTMLEKMEKLQADQAILLAEKEAKMLEFGNALKEREGFAIKVQSLLTTIQEDQALLLEQTNKNEQVLGKLKVLMDQKSKKEESSLGGPNISESDPIFAKLLEQLHDDAQKNINSRNSSLNSGGMENLSVILGRSLIQELPDFHGDEFEWAFFESVYNSSCTEGKFSDAQNIGRLRKVIKGEAKNFVNDQLMFSTKPSEIIDQLRLKYGDTSVILTRRLNELTSHPAVTKVNDVTLPKLANKVRIFVATAKSLKKENDLNQDYALNLIADKLRNTTYYIQWKRKKLANAALNIEDFGEFLQDKVREMPPDLRLGVPSSSGHDKNRDSKHHNGRVNVHSEGSKNIRCIKCGESHFMWKCPSFLAMNLEDKWKFVRNKRICRSCLSSVDHHQNDCPYQRPCGVSGCPGIHNRVLHYQLKSAEKQP